MQETPEQLFAKVWDHFVVKKSKVGTRKIEPNGYYNSYRGPDGSRCAIGVLVPDSEYVPGMEEMNSLQVLVLAKVIPPRISQDVANFLELLRLAHDHAAPLWFDADGGPERFVNHIKASLTAIARQFCLDIPGESTPTASPQT